MIASLLVLISAVLTGCCSRALPLSTSHAGTQDADCACDGYTFHDKITVLGYDIVKAADGVAINCGLARACDQTPGCVAFTSDGWLKSQHAPLVPANAYRQAPSVDLVNAPQHDAADAAAAATAAAAGAARQCAGIWVSKGTGTHSRPWQGRLQPASLDALLQLEQRGRRLQALLHGHAASDHEPLEEANVSSSLGMAESAGAASSPAAGGLAAGQEAGAALGEAGRAGRRLAATAEATGGSHLRGGQPRVASPAVLPSRWNSRSHECTGAGNWVSPPKHQGRCGACSVFATIAAAETAVAARLQRGPSTTNYLDLSEQDVYFCHDTNKASCGDYWDLVNAVVNLLDFGPVSEQCLPYQEPPPGGAPSCGRVPGCQALPSGVWDAVVLNTTAAIKTHIMQYGSVLTGLYIRDELWRFWASASEGVYRSTPGTGHSGGHGVMVYGWDDASRSWLVKNSWGLSGGARMSGMLRVSYDEQDVMAGNWPTLGLKWHPLPPR